MCYVTVNSYLGFPQHRHFVCPSSTISHLCNQFVVGIYPALQEIVCPTASQSSWTGFKLLFVKHRRTCSVALNTVMSTSKINLYLYLLLLPCV